MLHTIVDPGRKNDVVKIFLHDEFDVICWNKKLNKIDSVVDGDALTSRCPSVHYENRFSTLDDLHILTAIGMNAKGVGIRNTPTTRG